MEAIKERFAKVIFRMNTALNTFTTVKDYEDAAVPLVNEIVAICIPRYQVHLTIRHGPLIPIPEIEYVKPQPKLKIRPTDNFKHFTEFVSDFRESNTLSNQIAQQVQKCVKITTARLNNQDALSQEQLLPLMQIQNKELKIETKPELNSQDKPQLIIDDIEQSRMSLTFKTPFTLRKSDQYKPCNPGYPQNYSFPARPNYDNPFVAIDGKEQYWRFNFKLLSGEQTDLPTESVLFEKKFDPDAVRRVVLGWWNTDNRLQSMEFFDKENKSILRHGWASAQQKQYEIMLTEGERIVGFVSRNNGYALHYDFQLVIAKKY